MRTVALQPIIILCVLCLRKPITALFDHVFEGTDISQRLMWSVVVVILHELIAEYAHLAQVERGCFF